MEANNERTLLRTMLASNVLSEASKTVVSIARNAQVELDGALGKVMESVGDMARNGLRVRRTLYRALLDNERLALEWDAQQQRTIDMARKNWELENSFKAIGYYAEHLDDCYSRSGRDEKCSCGLATLWEMTHGIR